MKVSIDADECVGCGTCVDECPELFVMPEDLAVARIEVVPEDLQESCLSAAEACPVDAIIVEE